MLQKTQGIVLHSLKYKDTSIIVDIYTEVSGRASFLVPVSRSRKAAVKSVLFQPLSLVELEADFRPNTTIYKVKEAKSFYQLSIFFPRNAATVCASLHSVSPAVLPSGDRNSTAPSTSPSHRIGAATAAR